MKKIARDFEILFRSRGYNVKSVLGLYLENTAMIVVKGDSEDLHKISRDMKKIKQIHSIEIVEEFCYDDCDFEDPDFQAPIVDVLKFQVNYSK